MAGSSSMCRRSTTDNSSWQVRPLAAVRLFTLWCVARCLTLSLCVCVAGKLGKRWRLSDINKRYTRAPTYPEYIGTSHESSPRAPVPGLRLDSCTSRRTGVPVQVLDEVLSPIFEFRSKGRIPALCTFRIHHHTTTTRPKLSAWRALTQSLLRGAAYLFRNGASITRSSQPMVGFRGNSCPQGTTNPAAATAATTTAATVVLVLLIVRLGGG